MERLLWLLLLLGVAGGAQWYYPTKYDPQIASLQASLDKEELEQKTTRTALEQAGRDKEAVKGQLETARIQYEKRAAEDTKKLADLTSKLQEAQKPALNPANAAPTVVTAETPVQTVIGPDGSIAMVQSAPPTGDSMVDGQKAARLKAQLAADRATLTKIQTLHDGWHRGTIPDNISQAAIDALERQIRLEEAGMGD